MHWSLVFILAAAVLVLNGAMTHIRALGASRNDMPPRSRVVGTLRPYDRP